ncbi:hypothetical protein GCM10022239_11650 [Leifsonia bigeumensis]|uniref:Uncharacterized protein n=1 Tax=Leifsonella bigeumensis TaxID=433643 RepID=A0ABP7FGK9_9MICO
MGQLRHRLCGDGLDEVEPLGNTHQAALGTGPANLTRLHPDEALRAVRREDAEFLGVYPWPFHHVAHGPRVLARLSVILGIVDGSWRLDTGKHDSRVTTS